MAAIITENFRRRTASLLLSELKSQTTNDGVEYYVGIGKSDPWPNENQSSFAVQLPTGTLNDQKEVLSNLNTLIRVKSTDAGLVVPNIKYKTNSYYKVYDPSDDSCFYPDVRTGGEVLNPCYTVTNGNIYLCLRAGTGPSIDTPLQTTYGVFKSNIDNYVWALIDRVNLNDSSIVNTDQFITINSGVLSGAEENAAQIETGGLLYGFSVINGGVNYSSTYSTIPFIVNTEDETVRTIPCPIQYDISGKITSVSLPTDWDYDVGTSLNIKGGHFDFSNYEGGNATGALIVPRIAPVEGFAYSPSSILPSWYVSISVAAEGKIQDDGLFIPYRQISIIRNPEYDLSQIDSAGNETIDTLSAGRYLTIPTTGNATPPLNGLSTGDIITFNATHSPIGSQATRAFYDSCELVNGVWRIYFHQNDTTGYGLISPGSSGFITHGKSTTQITYSFVSSNEYNQLTGEVLFTENRRAVTRAESQTEQIKIIIQL